MTSRLIMRTVSSPRFSIIITCYNHSAFIKEAVDSALGQRYANSEVIVVDDCSQDDSPDILRSYGNAIKLIALDANGGVEAARNRGVAISDGHFLVFLDGDDLFLPWALETYSRVIAVKKPKLILANLRPFQASFAKVDVAAIKREISVVDYEVYLLRDRWFRISASSLIIERQAFCEAGQWVTGSFPWEDVDLTLRLGHAGRTILIASPETGAWRVHESNFSHKIQRQFQVATKIALKERSGGYPGRQYRFARRARIGNAIFPLLKRSWQDKFYRDGRKLFAASWPLLFDAVISKFKRTFVKARPEEKL